MEWSLLRLQSNEYIRLDYRSKRYTNRNLYQSSGWLTWATRITSEQDMTEWLVVGL